MYGRGKVLLLKITKGVNMTIREQLMGSGKFIIRHAYTNKSFRSYQKACNYANSFAPEMKAEVKPIGNAWGVYAFEVKQANK